jgi:hypothetical protein
MVLKLTIKDKWSKSWVDEICQQFWGREQFCYYLVWAKPYDCGWRVIQYISLREKAIKGFVPLDLDLFNEMSTKRTELIFCSYLVGVKNVDRGLEGDRAHPTKYFSCSWKESQSGDWPFSWNVSTKRFSLV